MPGSNRVAPRSTASSAPSTSILTTDGLASTSISAKSASSVVARGKILHRDLPLFHSISWAPTSMNRVAKVAVVVAGTAGGLAIGASLNPAVPDRFLANVVVAHRIPEPSTDSSGRALLARIEALADDARVVRAARQVSAIQGNAELVRTRLDGPGGILRITVRAESASSATAFAEGVAQEALRFAQLLTAGVLSIGDFESGAGLWGQIPSAFSLSPDRIDIVARAARFGTQSLRVSCSRPSCGTSLRLGFPFRAGVEYTVSAWVRSTTPARAGQLYIGFDSSDLAGSNPGGLRQSWKLFVVRWSPQEDRDAAEVTFQLRNPGGGDYDLDGVTLADSSGPSPTRPDPDRAVKIAASNFNVLPPEDAGTVAPGTVGWTLAGGGVGFLATLLGLLAAMFAQRRKVSAEPT